MLQLEHKKRIVDACYPVWSVQQREAWRKQNHEPTARELQEAWAEESIALWHDIKPIKFGLSVLWAAGTLELASYQIPEDASYLLILRVECYVTTFISTAPAFGQFAPPPDGTAFWEYTDIIGSTSYRITPDVPIHIFCDTDEFLFAKGDHRITLQAELNASPDANDRFIRTLVYGYLVGALVAGKIGDSESTYFGS